jgi:hypothetical protein
MRKVFLGIVGLAVLIAVIQTWAQAPQGKYSDPPPLPLAKPGEPIAGIPQDEALKIYQQHAEKLRQLPGVVSVGFTANGIMVETANPTVLPAAVEGLPVFAVPPVDPRAAGGLDYALANPPSKIEPTPIPESPWVPPPPPQVSTIECGTEAYWDPQIGRCRRNVPLKTSEFSMLPPPPGVTVLRSDGTRQQADGCPEGFEEQKMEGDWRFCVDPQHPEPIPPLMVPPIAGIPFEEAMKIFERRGPELQRIQGVKSIFLGRDGITVETDDPTLVPPSIEGVPVKIRPPAKRRFLSHTTTSPANPLHGAVATSDYLARGGGTMTGVVLSDGKPWLIFPSHIIVTGSVLPNL